MCEGMILIVAGGDWSETTRWDRLASSSTLTIAVDGGWAKARARGVCVDVVIGDLDSLRPEELEALRSSPTVVISHPRDKNETDLELALDYALVRSPVEIVVLGAFGGRLDHSLASVFLLAKGCGTGTSIVLVSGRETVRSVSDVYAIPSARVGDRVSLLPITESAVVRTIGLRFALHGERLHRVSSRGLSNEVGAVPVQIDVQEGTLLIVHAAGDREVDR
jgi:thiamine pyrophosphokinase